MPATYSFSEIKTMIPNLDGDETEMLRAVINEERVWYSVEELIEIYQLIMMHILELWNKEKEI